MRKIACLFFILIFMSIGAAVHAQRESRSEDKYDPARIYTSEMLNEDIRVLEKVLTGFHTGLYSYSDREVFSETLKQLKWNEKSMTERGFLDYIGWMSDVIKNGHTEFSTSREYWEFVEANEKLFPLKLRFLKGRAFIEENYSDSNNIPLGSELLAINGFNLSKILADIKRYVPVDGFNETRKYHILSKNFYRYYYLFFDQSSSFSVRIKGKRTGQRVHRINGVRIEKLKERDELPPLEFEIKNEETGILTVRTFQDSIIEKAGKKFTSFIDTVFSEIEEKKLKNLILDLRNNGGGSDGNGNYLYSYLADKEFNYYRRVEVLNPALDFTANMSGDDKREWGEVKGYFDQFAKKNSHGTFDFSVAPLLGAKPPLPPKANRFEGCLVVLIDGGSFSATGELASIIHSDKRGTFVGEEGGGNYLFNVSGYTPRLVLPNTKIRVSIPFMKYEMDVNRYPKGRGVIPDHEVISSINDILNDKDVQKEFALGILEKQNSQRPCGAK